MPPQTLTFLVIPAQQVEVRLDNEGSPAYLRGGPLVGEVEPVSHWRAELDWWDHPVDRDYWKVLLSGRLLCELYQDRAEGTWFVERVYD